ncbi:MAG: gluconate 2-dehydrogenase subunit 3 family protein [Steroidobacteraceae bacterium]
MRTVEAVCDCVLPSFADMPAGRTVGVPQFMALWISAPYPDQREDREKVMTALAELDATARQLHGRRFLRLNASRQESVFLAAPLHDPESNSSRLVDLLIIGYATSDDGMKAIGYLGNQVLPAFPGTPLELKVRFEKFKRTAHA